MSKIEMDLFEQKFPGFYNDSKEEFEDYYDRKEFMPKLIPFGINQILSTVSSCFQVRKTMKFKNDLHEFAWTASYVAVMMATKQVFPNGNKRMSLILLYFYLYCQGYEIRFEDNYYSEWVMDVIIAYENLQGVLREKFREIAINSLTIDCLDRAIPLRKKSIDENLQVLGKLVKNNFTKRT